MAGGKGTRVAGINDAVPKPMLRVADRPILEHQLGVLARQGVTDVTIIVGHLGQVIVDYFGDGAGFGVSISYITEDVPLGTAGALWFLKGVSDESFVLVNGDLIFDVDLHKFAAFHESRPALATILTHPNDHPFDSSLVEIESDGRVSGWFAKEDHSGWHRNSVNAGIHMISPALLETLAAPTFTDLDRDVLKPLIDGGGLFAYSSSEYVKDMGTPQRIAEVEADLLSGLVESRNLANPQRAVFLDRDGTINREDGFITRPEQIELIDGMAGYIRQVNHSGALAIVVTNQPVIARGDVTWPELYEIEGKLETLLGEQGAYVDATFICPHHPDSGFPGERPEYKIVCDCRKPKPGLLLQAAARYNIDLDASVMIGDDERDHGAALAAGVDFHWADGDVAKYPLIGGSNAVE
jgi:D,D-heptose 1,7-bisphosphate phosphatase